jgi:hypothetical protein
MAFVLSYLSNLWYTFSTPWLTVKEQSRIFVKGIKDRQQAKDFVAKALSDVANRDVRLDDKRILEIWTCTAIILVREDLKTAQLVRDTEKLRSMLDTRTKLYRMQQAVIFFILVFMIGLFFYQSLQVALNGGQRIDHRFEPLERVDFSKWFKKKEGEQ